MKRKKINVAKLKSQLVKFKKQEERAKLKLRNAAKKIKLMARHAKQRVARKVNALKNKAKRTHAVVYLKIAKDIEKQLLKKAISKQKALAHVIAKVEKKFVNMVAKKIAAKARIGRKRKVKEILPVGSRKKMKAKKYKVVGRPARRGRPKKR